MTRLKNETGDSLFSITKICETLFKRTHTKPEATIDFKLTKPKETISFKPLFSIEGYWMFGLTSLEVYNSVFFITEENNKLEH